jgi:hypothetical protein
MMNSKVLIGIFISLVSLQIASAKSDDLFEPNCGALMRGNGGGGSRAPLMGGQQDYYTIVGVNPIGSIRVGFVDPPDSLPYTLSNLGNREATFKVDELAPSCQKTLNKVVNSANAKWQSEVKSFVEAETALDSEAELQARGMCDSVINDEKAFQKNLFQFANDLDRQRSAATISADQSKIANKLLALENDSGINANGQARSKCKLVVDCINKYTEPASKKMKALIEQRQMDDKFASAKNQLQSDLTHLFTDACECSLDGNYGKCFANIDDPTTARKPRSRRKKKAPAVIQ